MQLSAAACGQGDSKGSNQLAVEKDLLVHLLSQSEAWEHEEREESQGEGAPLRGVGEPQQFPSGAPVSCRPLLPPPASSAPHPRAWLMHTPPDMLCVPPLPSGGDHPARHRHRARAVAVALPGGYSVGEMLYFTGGSQTANNGDRWVPGKQGKVMGPATGKLEGKGLSVYFDGNKGNLVCHLTALSRDAPSYPSADHSPASANTASQDKVALLSSPRRNAGCCSLQ